MSESKLPVYTNKNFSRRSANESRNFEVKVGIPIATHGRSFRDGLGISGIQKFDYLTEMNCAKLQKAEKSDRTRIPVNNCLNSTTSGEYQIKISKSLSKTARKFSLISMPSKAAEGKKVEIEPVILKETSCETSKTIQGISKSALDEIANEHQSGHKLEVQSDPFSLQIDKKLEETSNADTKTKKFEVKSDPFSKQIDEKLEEPSNADTKTDRPLDQTYVKSQSLSELIDEKLEETSNIETTDRPLDQTYVKSGSLSELIDEASGQAIEDDPALNLTYMQSRRLSDLIEEPSNHISESNHFSSLTGISFEEEKNAHFTREYGCKQYQPEGNVSLISKQIPCTFSKIPEENESLSFSELETFEPPQTTSAATAPHLVNEHQVIQPQVAVNTYSSTPVEILQQLENLSLKLYLNQQYLHKAIQLKKNLLLTMASGQDLSPENVPYQKVEDLEEAVDTLTQEESPDVEMSSAERGEDLYPVPWAGVKTVGFLFSLVGSNNVVSISPREAATTINQDVLIAHYEDYLKKAESKKDMVETIKKLMLDALELVEDRMESFSSFIKTFDKVEKGNKTVSYYGERRRSLLEGRIFFRQTADDFNLLFGRMDQYTMERAGLLHVLKTFLRTQVRLFPEYKNLSP